MVKNKRVLHTTKMVEEQATTGDVKVVVLTEDGGVTKKILVEGDEEGALPEKGQEVLVNYEGRLTDGTIFDSSYDKEALKVAIGEGQVIKGWDIGIMSMKLGEKAELTITPEYGYGAAGAGSAIPPNATLVFTVELMMCNNKRPTRWQLNDPELIASAERLKGDGNEKFKLQKFKEAEGHYRDALAHLGNVKADNDALRKLKVIILQNLSNCCLKSGDNKEAIAHCT